MSCTGTPGSYFRAIGSFSYEVVETKLARSTKARAILQLCFYSELLSDKFLVSRYIAFFRKLKRDFEEASKISGNTYPEPVELCDVCDWFPVCDKRRRA
jgi:predicted RecB family nuclease